MILFSREDIQLLVYQSVEQGHVSLFYDRGARDAGAVLGNLSSDDCAIFENRVRYGLSIKITHKGGNK